VKTKSYLAVVLVFTLFFVLSGDAPEPDPSTVPAPQAVPTPDAPQPEMVNKNYDRLIFEKSSYLLQHADNLVDWYPWGPEAFEKAQKEDKPIFLSIGYSTCHWCHVMEYESFNDPQVARLVKLTL